MNTKTIYLLALALLVHGGLQSQNVQPNNSNETKEKVSIGHTIHGNGSEKVIVLHDWMGDYENWETTIKYLSLDEFTYAFMEVRGYGKSRDLKGNYTSNEIANDVFNLADDLGWNTFHLVGHSMTGLAVQKTTVLDKGNRLKSVVAITPVPAAGFPLDEENKQFFLSIINNREMAQVGYGAMTSERLTSNWSKLRAQRFLEKVHPEACRGYLEMWTGENFEKDIAGTNKPFLVIAGQFDHPGFQLPRMQKAFDSFKNVEFIENLNAGHYPMEETPVFLATAIEKFFNQNK